MQRRPVVGISMGDPTGVGPEIIAEALSRYEIYEICRPLVVGDARVIEKACRLTGLNLNINLCKEIEHAKFTCGNVDVLDLRNADLQDLTCKRATRSAGKAALEYINKVIELALTKRIEATVTCPIHKKAISMAGCPYPGHTEIFARQCGVKDWAMMLVAGEFRIIHVTFHVALREVPFFITKEKILKVLRLTHDTMLDLGLKNPKIAVSGLNPHAGEEGLFGDEEIKEIDPAVKQAKREGINVEGPFPPDTIFVKLKNGSYDVAVAMYHDQGHIPFKFLFFKSEKSGTLSVRGVNVTLGLPIIRTSVDHGVAHDIAWEGKASPDSLIEAIKLAVQLAINKKQRNSSLLLR